MIGRPKRRCQSTDTCPSQSLSHEKSMGVVVFVSAVSQLCRTQLHLGDVKTGTCTCIRVPQRGPHGKRH